MTGSFVKFAAERDAGSGAEHDEQRPNLLYIGDVPVEASYHGSALLYRVLEAYPAGKLVIIEAGIETSKAERRLSGVEYHDRKLLFSRLQSTRFAAWYTAARLRSAAARAGNLEGLARSRRPEAILTVTHGYSWIAAAELARRLDIPLHLICHDEWARAGVMRAWKDQVFREHYRRAASRLCVSPFMAEEYARRYDAEALVLYPSRGAGAPRYDEPPSRLDTNAGPFTCVFAGTINSSGAVMALQQLARRLEPIGGRLLIYGPLTPEVGSASGLALPNVEFGGLLSSTELMEALRKRADTLFVPMSFEAADRNNMEISFPSKLADYTAVGLPLLIYGPSYCSAVRWAIANDGVAEIVTQRDEAALSATLARLARDPGRRMRLARRALGAGDAYFSHRAASEAFQKALSHRPGKAVDAPGSGGPNQQTVARP